MKDLNHLRHVDVHQFAARQEVVEGRVRLGDFSRLLVDVLPVSADQPVEWRVSCFQRTPLGERQPQDWLEVTAQALAIQTCQSCLEPVDVKLRVERVFRFVSTEEEALQQDEEAEEDVLVGAGDFNLFDLVEDELILSLPFIPRHGGCIDQYATSEETENVSESLHPNPFAVLQTLKAKR